MTAAGRWATTLIQAGMPVTGAIAGVAQRTEVSPGSSTPPRPWPLARRVASIPDLVAPPNSHSFERYARFEDAAELGELRALRAEPTASGLSVSDGTETYSLYLRDELPEETAKAFREFMGAWRFE